MGYRNAYVIIHEMGTEKKITEDEFNQLLVTFRNNYLEDKDYNQRLSVHRRPIEFKNEIINGLLPYLQEIQLRVEMRDYDEDKSSSGYVPNKVSEIWNADRRVKSLYKAVEVYCNLREKDFNTIAVHVTEYRSLTKLFQQIDRTINRMPSGGKVAQPKQPLVTVRHRHMHITNPEKLISELQKVKCGDKHIAELSRDDFEIRPYPTNPPQGYIAPENFPNCCTYHNAIYEVAKSAFDRFPNCCTGHKNLNKQLWFAKGNYKGMPERLLNALSYSEYHLASKIDAPDWYDDITEYFDYTLHSFGQFPSGHGSPLGIGIYSDNLVHYIGSQERISKEKKSKLVDFLKDFGRPSPKTHTNLNLLIATYKKWVSIFPFQLLRLSHLKTFFENTLPLLSGKPVLNRYTGLLTTKILTLDELFAWLANITGTIISELSAVKFFEQGKITELKKTKLEYLNASRKLELEELTVTRLSDRPEYIRVLKKWFAGEKKYLKELAEILPIDEQTSVKLADEKPIAWQNEKNVFCPRMPVSIARDHFSVLVTTKSSNGKPFLSAESLNLFVRKAILGEKGIARQNLNVGPREKYFVIKRFYEFYQLAVRDLYEEHSQVKLKYIKLLTDNFGNWKQAEIESNFADKSKRSWS